MQLFHFVSKSSRCRLRAVFAALLAAGVASSLVAATAQAATPQPKLQILQRWAVGGDGSWDYLAFDARAKRLFVSRESRVDVISAESGSLVGSIPGTSGVHGIAIANDVRRGFTSNGTSNTVTAFDLDTLRVVQVADVPARNPDAILYDRRNAHLFTFNGHSNDATVLDATNLKVVARITLPDKPEFAVNDGDESHVFVNIESDPGRMTVIDTQSLGVKSSWDLPGCDSPTGLAIDRAQHRLFSVCDGKVMVVTDSQTGKQVASLRIGEHPDAAAYDPQRGLVYSSNGDGTLTVIHQDSADHYTVIQTLATKRGARTMTLDPDTGKVYLVTADLGPAPAPTDEQPNPRPVPVPGSFVVLVVGP